jgi:hypothetical protein
MSQLINKRVPIAIHDGKHNAIISDELFLQNQERRKARCFSPGNDTRKRRIYPLKGVGKCWECWVTLGEVVGLRGSTGGRNSYALYRCGARHDRAMRRKRKFKSSPQAALERTALQVNQNIDLQTWADRHHTLQEKVIMAIVEDLLGRINIPQAWHRDILAYIHHPDGILHYEIQVRAFKTAQRELKRLYQFGEIDLAELQIEGAKLQAKIDSFWQASFEKKDPFEKWLTNFHYLWGYLKPFEKNNLLNLMFGGLFFDGQGKLRWILAHSPFDQLLGLPEGGMILEL